MKKWTRRRTNRSAGIRGFSCSPRFSRAILLAAASAVAGSRAHAADQYWNTNGGGTWDTGTTSNWSSDQAGANPTTWANNDSAIFSSDNVTTGSPFFVTFSGTPSISGLQMSAAMPLINFNGGFALNPAGNNTFDIGSAASFSGVVSGAVAGIDLALIKTG